MTLTELQRYLNTTATIPNVLPGMSITVRIVNVRQSFGRIDAQVEPIAGAGSAWVAITRLEFDTNG